jgi:hypothetical protein
MVHVSRGDQTDGDICGALEDRESVMMKVLKVRCGVGQQPIMS